jgi:hypothetical protein
MNMDRNFEQAFMKFLEMAAMIHKEMEAQKMANDFERLPEETKAQMIATTKKFFPNAKLPF